jgi:hypothetical protein
MNQTFTLTKTQLKNGKFKYVVTDQDGNIISDRTSAREYVACTACGGFYFGRLDLIGKGTHGLIIKDALKSLQWTREEYATYQWTSSYEEHIEGKKNLLNILNSIAYLNQ